MKKNIFLLFFILIVVSSCKKDESFNGSEYVYSFEVISEEHDGDSIRIVDVTNNVKGEFKKAESKNILTFRSGKENIVFGLEIKDKNGNITQHNQQIFVK